jgi:hypothetical protein
VRAAAARVFRPENLGLLTVGALTASESKRLGRIVAALA